MPLLPLARLLACGLVVLAVLPAAAQPLPAAQNRVPFNGQQLWLSGGNVAWVNFASDVGPGSTNLAAFDRIFEQAHASGGNAMRLWLHTSGTSTPEWSTTRVGEVVGPGAGTVEDLRAILDLAWQHEIGLQLCLWSFDMLRLSNGATTTDRAYALLTDSARTQTYIDHALLPLVEALRGHPALMAWEVFNEPEGMSVEHGWSGIRRVPMRAIQRFVNQTAGAIHRAAPGALVTNGAWAFISQSDTPTSGKGGLGALAPDALETLRQNLSEAYRMPFTPEGAQAYRDALGAGANFNYYRDDRLVAAGGDPLGTLDFYNVHYYEWAGTALSPFHHDYSYWGLDKPLVVAEFFMGTGTDDGNPNATYGIPQQDLYTTLYSRGYAGALAWQWYNYPNGAEGVVNWPRMLTAMQSIAARYPDAVDVRPGLRIHYFTATPAALEAGQTASLAWNVTGAARVTLDGLPADSTGTRAVAPTQTTTYTLVAVDRLDATRADTARVTVEVRLPGAINRALGRPAAASTVETCCGEARVADFAFDGDPGTRWSSEWETGLADADPDSEWVYVDLGSTFDVGRVVLRWEAAFASAYALDVSFDARHWQTVYTQRQGRGGLEEVAFETPPAARFVRMRGLGRATRYGYSLWEMEVYGLASSRTPPAVQFSAPVPGALVAAGSPVTLVAAATDADGSVARVDFYDGDRLLGRATAAPFSLAWAGVPAGAHALTAVATDSDGFVVGTAPFPVFGVADGQAFTRYEAEGAQYTGEVTRATSALASGRAYLDMKGSGTLTFTGLAAPSAGDYLLVFGYNLAYDVPKTQTVRVNGGAGEEVVFGGAKGAWQRRGLVVALEAGLNTVAVEKNWGWMQFDYVEVGTGALGTAAQGPAEPLATALGPNTPNPFRGQTTILFTLDAPGAVRLEILDVTGRRVALLVDETRPAGQHAAVFDARGLASGVYLCRLRAGATVAARPLLLVR